MLLPPVRRKFFHQQYQHKEAPGITKTAGENIVIKQSVIFAITTSMQDTRKSVGR